MYGKNMVQEIAFLKLDVKFPFLITDDPSKYAIWRTWYPEANKYIGKNKMLSLRSTLLQYLAVYNQFWAVSLYYKVVYKLIYKAIYK